MLRGAMKYSLLAGDRRGGLRWAAQLLRREPYSLRAWVIFVSGLIHPLLLARIEVATMRMPSLPGSAR